MLGGRRLNQGDFNSNVLPELLTEGRSDSYGSVWRGHPRAADRREVKQLWVNVEGPPQDCLKMQILGPLCQLTSLQYPENGSVPLPVEATLNKSCSGLHYSFGSFNCLIEDGCLNLA